VNLLVPGKKPTVRDVARFAGVSLASVDRVLNFRIGVKLSTREKVERAVAALNYSRDIGASLLARGTSAKIHFILPGDENPFMRTLGEAVLSQAHQHADRRTQIFLTRVGSLDVAAQVKALNLLSPNICDCVIIAAIDDPRINQAIAQAVARDIIVLTLVSDLPDSRRHGFVGIDNIAAGRTAGSLLGRFCPGRQQVALIAGSMELRDHRQRFIGFHDKILEDFADLELVGPVEGLDNDHETSKRAYELLSDYPDLAGIYSMGAGTQGLISALLASGRAQKTRIIVHELNEKTVNGLNSGVLDVVLDQNPQTEIRIAIERAQQACAGLQIDLTDKPIDISIYMRDNLLGRFANTQISNVPRINEFGYLV
jgi:LacI family transcriptional regulator